MFFHQWEDSYENLIIFETGDTVARKDFHRVVGYAENVSQISKLAEIL